jgi:hypothetical protein
MRVAGRVLAVQVPAGRHLRRRPAGHSRYTKARGARCGRRSRARLRPCRPARTADRRRPGRSAVQRRPAAARKHVAGALTVTASPSRSLATASRRAACLRVALDHSTASRATRHRLEAQRAAAGEQIEHARPACVSQLNRVSRMRAGVGAGPAAAAPAGFRASAADDADFARRRPRGPPRPAGAACMGEVGAGSSEGVLRCQPHPVQVRKKHSPRTPRCSTAPQQAGTEAPDREAQPFRRRPSRTSPAFPAPTGAAQAPKLPKLHGHRPPNGSRKPGRHGDGPASGQHAIRPRPMAR